MKKLMTFLFLLIAVQADSAPEDDFVISIIADLGGGLPSFLIPTNPEYAYNYNVDCNNDGFIEAEALTGDYTCIYPQTERNPSIRIIDNSGNGTGFPHLDNPYAHGSALQIIAVEQWGTGQWLSMKRSFDQAWNLEVLASDVPDLSRVSDMSYMFQDASIKSPDLNDWDVSSVTNMSGLFADTTITSSNVADPDISTWDTSNVTDMSYMFYGTDAANPDVSNWDVSAVKNMSHMFYDAKSATPNVSAWDVSAVTDMSFMFYQADQANPDVSNWNVSSVKDMSVMFYRAQSAEPDVSNWDVSSVTNMAYMFFDADQAKPDVSDWDVSSVTLMFDMFANTLKANPDVSAWDVSGVIDMSEMFKDTNAANPDVSAWNVSSVTNMSGMFNQAKKADPDVSAWDVSSVTNMSYMFSFTSHANPDVKLWDTAKVKDMAFMFAGTSVSHPDVSDWDVSAVTNMNNMFSNARSMNPDVSNWDVSSVVSFIEMFSYSYLANPDVSNWDLSSAEYLNRMFAGAYSANPNVSDWDVSTVKNMLGMFGEAYSANPDVSKWDTSNVSNMAGMFQGATSAQPDISNWNIEKVAFLDGIFGYLDFLHISIPPHLYDDVLTNFSEQDVNSGISLAAGNSQYCLSAAQRAVLEDQYFWTIEDGGQNCGVNVSAQLSDFKDDFAVNGEQNVSLWVKNTGFEDADDVIISTFFSDGLNDLTWSCEAIVGQVSCPLAQGEGNLNQILDLAQGDQLHYKFEFSVADNDEYYAHALTELNTATDVFPADNQSFISQTAVNVFSDTSGAWYDENNPGHGIFLNLLDGGADQVDQLLMYWFTYHQQQPVWFYGTGELNKHTSVSVIKLYNSQGTDFPPGFSEDELEINHWGWAILDFTQTNLLNFSWRLESVETAFNESYGWPGGGPIQLTQLSTVSDSMKGCFSGTFYHPDESGHGLYIHVTDAPNDQQQINVSWFVYHQGEQLWLVGSGLLDENDSSEINLSHFTGASFFDPDSISGWSFNQDDLIQSTWGKLNVQYVDKNNIEIEYLPVDGQQFESGQMDMTRLTAMKGHVCNNR